MHSCLLHIVPSFSLITTNSSLISEDHLATEFWIELRGNKYDPNSGWHCSALTLPGAEITKIVVGGDEKPLTNFTVDAAQVRFVNAPNPVPDGAAKVTLRKRLITIDTAIVVALIGLVGTLLSSWFSYQSGKAKEPNAPAISTRPADVTPDLQPTTPGLQPTGSAQETDLSVDQAQVRSFFTPFCLKSNSGTFAYCGFTTLAECQARWDSNPGGPFKSNHSCVPKPSEAYCFAYRGNDSASRQVCLSTSIQCESTRNGYRHIPTVFAVAKTCQSFVL